MAEEMESHVPALGRISERSHGEIVEGLDRSLGRWAEFLASGTMPADRSFDPLRGWARSRAEEGVRLEDLLHSFAAARQLAWRLLRRSAHEDEQEALLELAALTGQYHDRVAAVAAETYLGEREALVSEVERGVRNLLDGLCEEGTLGTAERELADGLGVPLEVDYRPFVILAPRHPRHRQRALADRLRSSGRALAVTEGDAVTGITWTNLDLADLGVGGEALLVIGEPALAGQLMAGRRDVGVLAEYGRRTGLHGRVEPRHYLLEILIGRSPRLAAELRHRVLDPLAGEERTELVQTLEALLDCRFDRTAASAALHIHRNTLTYRLRRIEQITELDLGNPRDLVCMYVAVTTQER